MPGIFRRPPPLPPAIQSPLASLTQVAGAVFAGTTTIVFGQSGSLSGGATLAGSSAIVFGQSGTLKAGATLAGSSAIVFGQTGTLTAGATLAGSTAITFGQSGSLSGGATLAGTTPIVFGATGTLVAGSAGAANFAGTIAITFGATGTLVAGGGAVQGPRGAWISDERVEKARRKQWERQRQAQEDFRRYLTERYQGKPEIAPQPVSAPIPLVIAQAFDAQQLQALRAQLELIKSEVLRQQLMQMAIAEAEAIADEEAGLVALLMAA